MKVKHQRAFHRLLLSLAIIDTIYLVQALLANGFERDEVRKIMGGNAIRVFRQTLPAP